MLEPLGGEFSKKELIIASEQMISWLLDNNFLSIFQRLLPVIVFFLSFRLVETDFRANNGFHKKIEKL